MKLTQISFAALSAFVAASVAHAQPSTSPVAVTPVGGSITTDTTWGPLGSGADVENPLMTSYVFVEGATLTILPGTVVRAQDENVNDDSDAALGLSLAERILPGSLIVTRDAMIMADGTPTNPIIFTYEADNADPFNNPSGVTSRGLWGGVILLGNAPTNLRTEGGSDELVGGGTIIPYVGQVEGVAITPGDARANYGGGDPNDNSGVMRYVSIRHGGNELSPNNEINGLTLGGVGYGTELEFVEVFSNLDDGFEWFGGTTFSKNLSASMVDDDGFDWDQGYNGLGQFWFTVGVEDSLGGSNRGAEMDGGTGNDESERPFAVPTVYNATYIGSANENDSYSTENVAMTFRDNSGGFYYNSIFAYFGGVDRRDGETAATDFFGVFIEDRTASSVQGLSQKDESSRSRLENQEQNGKPVALVDIPQLKIDGSIFWNVVDTSGPGSSSLTFDNTWNAILGGYVDQVPGNDAVDAPANTSAVVNQFVIDALAGSADTNGVSGPTLNQIVNPVFAPEIAGGFGSPAKSRLLGPRTDPAGSGGVTVKPVAAAATDPNTLVPYTNSFFDVVSYKGAFNPVNPAWTGQWAAVSQYIVE